MFIESHRLSIFQGRCADVSVVLDLMIHDIDLILNFVGSEISEIRASGVSVISEHIDIANARLEFKSGCVANVTASRISTKNERKIRLFQTEDELKSFVKAVDRREPPEVTAQMGRDALEIALDIMAQIKDAAGRFFP